MNDYKLGRLPRTYDPGIPCMSALMGLAKPLVVPPAINYAEKLPDNLGMMLNDSLGDCTCAAYYHAIQVWSFNAEKRMITEPNIDVLHLYEAACGYSPLDPSTDQGGVEQDVLKYLLNHGAPTGFHAETRHKIRAFVEVDFRNKRDVKRAIYECGCLYIGFEVPQSIMPDSGEVPKIWDVGGDETILGGHAIILTGYDEQGLDLISWGQKYRLTWAFLEKFNDEAYAICDIDWFDGTGKSLLGMTVAQLKAAMSALKK